MPKTVLTKSGFTLVELMVVISIIAILATIGLTVYTQAQKSARDAKRQQDLQEIQKALEQYYAVNQNYSSVASIYSISNFGSYFAAGAVPTDTQTTSNYTSFVCTGTYRVCAKLEVTTNGNMDALATTCSSSLVPSSSGRGFYCVGNISN